MTDIIDLIDNAIEDWSTSGDAMRWSPEPREPSLTGGWLWGALRRAWDALEPTTDAPSLIVRLDTNPAGLLTPESSDDRLHYATATQGRFYAQDTFTWYPPPPVGVRVTYSTFDEVVTLPPMALTPWDAALSAALYGNAYLPARRWPRSSRVSRMHRSYSARLRARRRRRRG